MNLLAIPALSISLFSLMICYKNNKSLLYPGVLFNFIWSFAIIANQINLNGFYDVHEITYLAICIGIAAFNVPFLYGKSTANIGKFDINSISRNSTKIILFIQLVLLAMIIPLAIKAVPFYRLYGSTAFRTIVADSINYGYMNTLERMLYIHYGVFPLCLVTNSIMIFLWINGATKLRYLFPGLISEGLISFCTGSRGNFLIIMFVLLQALLFSNESMMYITAFMKKIKRQAKWICLALILILVFISIQRGNVGEGNFIIEFAKTISVNFSGGIQLFDLALQEPSEWGLNDYYCGVAVLNGFLQVFSLLISIITFRRINIRIPSVTSYASSFFYVSNTQRMNAYVTVFYTFMQDFGWIGLIVEPIIIGAIAVGLFRRTKREPCLYNLLMMSFLNIVLLFSTIRWRLMLTDWASMFIYAYILCRILQGKNFKSRIRWRR